MNPARPDREPAERRLRHLSGSILSVGASRGASLLSIAFTSIVVARMIGAAGIGAYAIGHALLLVFTVLFELGLPQALAYYAAREEWGGGPLARGVLAACFGLALPGCAAMLAGFALFGDALPEITWPMAIALTTALPFSLLWRIGPQAALAQERFEAFAALDSAPALLLCPTSIVGAALGGTQGAVIGLAVATVGSGIAIAAWLLLNARDARAPAAPPGGARAILGFGLRAWGAELLMQINLRLDLILVGAYVGAAVGGIYSIALSTTGIAWTLTAAFAVSALPRSARLHSQSERALIDSRLRDEMDARTTRHAVLFAPVAAVGIVLLLTIGIPLFYGSAFHRSIGFGFILLPGSAMLGLGMAAVSILLGRGQTRRVLRVCLAVVPPTAAAYLLAIPAGGATVAAIVSSTSYLAFTAVAVLELRAASGLTGRELLVPRRTDIRDYQSLASRGLGALRRRASTSS
jgi:O-antigen/teichoic acid export membrane protein